MLAGCDGSQSLSAMPPQGLASKESLANQSYHIVHPFGRSKGDGKNPAADLINVMVLGAVSDKRSIAEVLLKATPLISGIEAGLKEVQGKIASERALSREDVSSIRDSAHQLVYLIEQQGPAEGNRQRY